MNQNVISFIKKSLIEGLLKCTESQVLLFRRMYDHENIYDSIEDMVNNMPEEKLDWALTQVDRTLEKINEKNI